jgi:hypothetical protein
MDRNVYNWAFPEQQMQQRMAERRADARSARRPHYPQHETSTSTLAWTPVRVSWWTRLGSRVLAWVQR